MADVEVVKLTAIQLSPAEIQSGHDRVRWAQGLIEQLPKDHDGRNSWLLNYGIGDETDALRAKWEREAAYPTPLPWEAQSNG